MDKLPTFQKELIVENILRDTINTFWNYFSIFHPEEYLSEFTMGLQKNLDESPESNPYLEDDKKRLKILEKAGYKTQMDLYSLNRIKEADSFINNYLSSQKTVSKHN